MEIPSKGLFIVSQKDSIVVYSNKSFNPNENIVVPPMTVSDTDDAVEIMKIVVSPDQSMVAFMTGKNLIKEEEELDSIYIYIINEFSNLEDVLELKYNIKLPEKYKSFSKSFHFCATNPDSELIMVNHERLIKYNYQTA